LRVLQITQRVDIDERESFRVKFPQDRLIHVANPHLREEFDDNSLVPLQKPSDRPNTPLGIDSVKRFCAFLMSGNDHITARSEGHEVLKKGGTEKRHVTGNDQSVPVTGRQQA